MPPVENQGSAPTCVGAAVSAIAHSIGHSVLSHVIYAQAQLIDRIPGENYDGTEISAALRVLENMGLGRAYQFSIKDIDQILKDRPVIISMKPNPIINGSEDHAMVVVAKGESVYTLRNSWGPQWGSNGYINLQRSELMLYAHLNAYSFVKSSEENKKKKKALLPFIIGGAVIAIIIIAFALLS